MCVCLLQQDLVQSCLRVRGGISSVCVFNVPVCVLLLQDLFHVCLLLSQHELRVRVVESPSISRALGGAQQKPVAMPLHDDLVREKGIPVVAGGTRLPCFAECPPGLCAPLGTCRWSPWLGIIQIINDMLYYPTSAPILTPHAPHVRRRCRRAGCAGRRRRE